jgi:hypothetical protein
VQSPDRKPPPALAEGQAAQKELDDVLAQGPSAAPIDHARRARAGCLRALTMVRRDSSVDVGSGGVDAVLADLSKLGHGAPRRDERGLVVTLRDLFDGDAISKKGGGVLSALADTAAKHAGVVLLVVVHRHKQGLDKSSAERAKAVAASLRTSLGDGRVGEPQVAGVRAPVVDPAGRYAAQNDRVEIIFVAPRTL